MTSFSLDLSLLATLFGIIMVVLTGLVYWGKPNFLIYVQKQVISEMAASNKELLEMAERYSHGTRLSGPKIRIKRKLGSFSCDYVVPNSVMEVSALAAVAWLFCFFLVVASFIYTGIQSLKLLNIILLTAQTNMVVMAIMAWFGKNNNVEKPILFLMSLFVWWVAFTVVGCLMGLGGLSLQIIPTEHLHYAYYSFWLIPFIPIMVTVYTVFAYRCKEKQKYSELGDAVFAFEKFRKEESQRKK